VANKDLYKLLQYIGAARNWKLGMHFETQRAEDRGSKANSEGGVLGKRVASPLASS